jgi:acetylornithine/succinyldiaminopimelate/putrescine aminotransferase
LACRAALASFHVVRKSRLDKRAVSLGRVLKASLEALKREFSFVREIRGMGLMMAIELSIDGVELVKKCLSEGLLINCTQGNVVRFLPSMTITEAEIHRAIEIVRKVFKEVK